MLPVKWHEWLKELWKEDISISKMIVFERTWKIIVPRS